jgi:hypothetical protein
VDGGRPPPHRAPAHDARPPRVALPRQAPRPPPPARHDARRRVSRPPASPRPEISPRQQWKLYASATGNLASTTSTPSSSLQHCGQSIDVSRPVRGNGPPLHATAHPSHRLRRHLLLSRRQWKERTSSPHGRYVPLRPQIARRHRRSARPPPPPRTRRWKVRCPAPLNCANAWKVRASAAPTPPPPPHLPSLRRQLLLGRADGRSGSLRTLPSRACEEDELQQVCC